MKKNLKELEKKIGYEFQDFSLLEQAMIQMKSIWKNIIAMRDWNF